MIQTQDIMKCLPLLASVLGDRYGVTVEIGGTDAYTDGKTIHIPAMQQGTDATSLALTRAYVDHESGHIRDTDFECLRRATLSPFVKHIWNIIEDWRIEHTLSEIFPGCRQNFNWMIQHLFTDTNTTDTRAEEKSPALSVLDWLLLEVRSWDVSAVIPERDKKAQAVDAAYPKLCSQCTPVLQRIQHSCKSTQDSIAYAHELVLILKKEASQYQNTTNTEQSSSESHHKNHTNKEDSENDTPKQELRKLIQADAESLPKSVGEALAQELRQARQDVGDDSRAVAVEGQKDFFSLSPQELQRADCVSVALRTRLHALLQASTLQHCISGRRGKLNTRKLYHVVLHDPHVFVTQGRKQSPDTAVHILMDTSGSMVRNITIASTACYSLTKAIQTIPGLSVGVSTFPSRSPMGNPVAVAPLLHHGERLHTRFALRPSGETPLAQCLWRVMQVMLPLRELRKIILILTDGEPDSLPLARTAIADAERAGYEVYGIGIGNSSIAQLLPGKNREIHSIEELTPAMFSLMQAVLLKK